MKIEIKFLIFCFLIFLTTGCTTAGSKFIQIKYLNLTESSTASIVGDVGIADFLDKREYIAKDYLGKRILNSGNQELYFVKGRVLSSSVTQAFRSFFTNAGYNCHKINRFEPNVESLKKADKKYKYILTGEIKEFEFFATKEFKTSMILDIKVVVYLGNINKGVFSIIPVNLNLKRSDINFSEKKVEQFINESLTEVICKALKRENLE